MSIPSVSAFRSALAHPLQVQVAKDGITVVTRFPYASWRITGSPVQGGIPSSPVAVSSATSGAFPFPGGSLNNLRILQADWSMGATGGGIVLVDFLTQQGGLSGTVTTAQTTNLPTAALTRYTSGAGVLAAVQIYSNVGSTGTFFTCSYTNQDGTSGRTSKATRIGTSNYNGNERFLIMSMADGDTGVRSVESLTLAGTTGTAGNFGITLFKPIAILASDFADGRLATHNMLVSGGLQMAAIESGACLGMIMMQGNALTSWQSMTMNLLMAEDP